MRRETLELPYVMMVLSVDGRYLEMTLAEGQYRDELVLSLYAGGVEHSGLEANLNPADVAELVELLPLWVATSVSARAPRSASIGRQSPFVEAGWTTGQMMAALPDEVRDSLTRYSVARKAWGAAEIVKALADDEPVRSKSDGEVKNKIDQKAKTFRGCQGLRAMALTSHGGKEGGR